MNKDHDISVVNDLIQVTIDSSDGYRKAADLADNHEFQRLFYARADERNELVERMQDYVRMLGGTPEDDGSFVAGAHRLFVDLHAKVAGADEEAIVADVEAGEDHIKAQFENALMDEELDPQTRSLIASANTVVLAGHDQMRDIKHAMQAVSRARS
jgi:uncharacterized protein (TIGR02284 family)